MDCEGGRPSHADERAGAINSLTELRERFGQTAPSTITVGGARLRPNGRTRRADKPEVGFPGPRETSEAAASGSDLRSDEGNRRTLGPAARARGLRKASPPHRLEARAMREGGGIEEAGWRPRGRPRTQLAGGASSVAPPGPVTGVCAATQRQRGWCAPAADLL